MRYTSKPSKQNQPSRAKPLTCDTSAPLHSPTNSDASNLCYEPNSVLDICQSPAHTIAIPPASDLLINDDVFPLQWDEQSDDWEKLFIGLGLSDDTQHFHPSQLPVYSIPPSDFTLYDHDNLAGSDWNTGFDFLTELTHAAECIDSNDFHLARSLLSQMNQRFQSPAGKPLQRTAFYFKEALQYLLNGSNRSTRLSASELVQTIHAYKALSRISPVPMFAHFAVNQALLEALDGSSIIHAVDFDIGLGGKWASFMKELAYRSEAQRSVPPLLRITAVVSDEFESESRLIAESLIGFARDNLIGFRIDFVSNRCFEAVRFMEGERVGIHVSPETFARVDMAGFLSGLRRISPQACVFVDGEGCADALMTHSFKRNFLNGIEFYATVLESLDASGGSGEWIRRIEECLVRPRILGTVELGGRVGAHWKEVLEGVGMRALQVSRLEEFQAECLLAKVQMKGFHVEKRQGEMVLFWQQSPLVATSAWCFC